LRLARRARIDPVACPPPTEPSMPPSLTRRHFLLSAACASVSTLAARAAKRPAPGDRLRLGAVGIAGQGGGDLGAIAAAGAEVIALCDVDTKRREVGQMRERFGKAKFYTDFRKMIDAGGLDAVMVAT